MQLRFYYTGSKMRAIIWVNMRFYLLEDGSQNDVPN